MVHLTSNPPPGAKPTLARPIFHNILSTTSAASLHRSARRHSLIVSQRFLVPSPSVGAGQKQILRILTRQDCAGDFLFVAAGVLLLAAIGSGSYSPAISIAQYMRREVVLLALAMPTRDALWSKRLFRCPVEAIH